MNTVVDVFKKDEGLTNVIAIRSVYVTASF